ncbi:MAG: hypothetical protein CMC76_06820 [Flavobacteriaceae bacterium]|nr:hypothetical protein [Flavobacteriaceae bacterium]|tara:strand:+ start:4202 stop:5611 length:1410 start_codon:yes stop_codon:yes gene_type:complete
MKSNYFLLAFILLSSLSFGQNKIPKISGTAKFSVERGTIDCDITLSDYSHLRDYLIRLNKGLNILNIQNVESKPFLLNYDREFADTLQTDETVSYYIPANIRGEKYLPTKLRFQYTGKFPIINDTISENFQKSDWRGNITFMNGLLRVDGFQSGLFPTLYDIDTDYQFDIIKYDIEIICEDCEQIYMNGSLPVNNNHARFKTDSPKEPYLFIGKYDIQNGENITLLNADFNKEQVLEFDKINGEIVEFLSSYTNISYKEKIYWVQAYLTTKEKGYFAFASNPTFTICGNPPSDLKTTFNNQLKGGFLLTIAHELSHYYFGTIKNCNTTLENLINEGFAEFMSLKFAQNLGMEEQVRQSIMERLEYVADDNFKFKPIGTIENLHDINDRETYGYDYQTLILFSIEKEIGEAKMKKWIQLLLQDQKPISDKIFLKQTLKTAVENDKIYTNIINKYFHGTHTIKNIYKTLSK